MRKIKTEHTNENMDEDQAHNTKESEGLLPPSKPTSLTTLIFWNISKVLEKKPHIDLKKAIKTAQESLELGFHDVNTIISQSSEERHLTCAFLAWQQLGHSDTDSLYRLIEEKKKNNELLLTQKEIPISIKKKESKPQKHLCCSSFNSYSVGPVIKLPVEPKTVLRMNCTQNSRPLSRKPKEQERQLMNKIETACCMDSDCMERLAELDSVTKELRTRAGKLARREAERVELLERAEAAWKDLEMGFQRRLTLLEEKEDDTTKQIQKLIEERNEFKNSCLLLPEQLKNKSEAVEKEHNRLKQMEKELCDRACTRLRLSEESARTDITLAEQQGKVAILERDQQFKEEQASRTVTNLKGEVEAMCTLTHEVERALRAELGAIKEQITQVSGQLLEEDSKSCIITAELEDMLEEKMELVEDLEGCRLMCDGNMQEKVDELAQKKEKLSEIKDKVMECRCKLPVDVAVEVKRTPSLVALCRCTADDKILETCSCVSLRSQLLSNLLADLFGGLQSELGDNGSQMPCKLLKCLEDTHNWDRASIVKSNLKSFFSQLLIGELDIAIATSIENYHAKWVGLSCVDVAKMPPSPGEREDEGWQERALERRAQKLAINLAEQLFQDKAEELAQRTKEIVTKTGPPPCECKPQTAVFQCLVKPPPNGAGIMRKETGTPAYWRKTQQDVTLLKVQIEDLKKASIKKEDLKLMEEKITKIVKRTSGPDSKTPVVPTEILIPTEENIKKESKNYKVLNAEQDAKNSMNDKQFYIKRKQLDKNKRKYNKIFMNPNDLIEKSHKSYKTRGQSFAVNLCLCSQKNPKKVVQQETNIQNVLSNERKTFWKQNPSNDEVSKSSNVKQTKPITTPFPSEKLKSLDKNAVVQPMCKSNCICFNKIPSNTSIDKLLKTLTKWKCDLIEPFENENITNGQIVDKNCLKNYNVLESIDILKNSPYIIDKDLKTSKNSLNLNLNKKVVPEVLFNTFNQMKLDPSKTKDLEPPILISRESKFLGTVNFDKSNENFCENVENTHNENECNEMKGTNFLYKSFNSDACNLAKSLSMNTKCNRLQKEVSTQNENDLQGLQTHLIDVVSKGTSILGNKPYSKMSQYTNAKSHEKIVDSVNQSGIKKVVQTELFPCGCDYYIQFLGVTLSNTRTDKNFKNSDEINGGSPYVKNSYETMAMSLQPKSKVKLERKALYKRRGDHINNEDKALDTQSFKDISEKQECMCCEKDESKDLELNTFHLLEEYLKGKLKEFKQSTCKSSCIPPDEEEKIFSSIFQKVKHVLSESTNKIVCKCSKEIQSIGSWNRAYGLLEEYLKIKIKRVQCLCVSSNEKKDVVLPDILDKVCSMIEKDFQRLQSICTCNNNGAVIKSLYLENKKKLEEPLKDMDRNLANTTYEPTVTMVCNFSNNKSVDKLSKQISKTILTQNMSSQVSHNLGMETKSCDAMEKSTKQQQTINPSNKNPIKQSQLSQFKYEEPFCCSSSAVKNESSRYELFEDPNDLTNYCSNFAKNEDCCEAEINVRKINKKSLSCPVIKSEYPLHVPIPIPSTEQNSNDKRDAVMTNHIDGSKEQIDLAKNKLPYVGYTINCSCDTKLGTCLCTKSIVLTDNENINSFWKTLIADSSRPCDVSYVMNGPKHSEEIKNENTYNTSKTYNSNKNSACETEMCLREEGLVLKDSNIKFSTTHNTTNTLDVCLSPLGRDSNYYNEEPIDWYDCGSQIHKNSTIPQNNDFESSYFPASLGNHKRQTKCEILLDSDGNKSKSLSNCECDLVPICHVKLLVENIENKLIHSQCTCDALSSKVCPIHSNTIY